MISSKLSIRYNLFFLTIFQLVVLTSQSIYSQTNLPPFTWTGKIVKQDNTAVNGINLQAFLDNNGKKIIISTKTDNNGNFIFNELSTGIKDEDQLPLNFELYQNYPNPFNPSTIIKYKINTTSKVKLEIFSVNGENIKTLIDKEMNPGTYSIEWSGDNDKNEGVSAGVYLYRIQVNNQQAVKKMILLDGCRENNIKEHGPSVLDDESKFVLGTDLFTTQITIDSIQVYGTGIQKRTFTSENWKNMPTNYELGIFKVLENGWNELIIGPLVSLGFNTPLKNFQVMLGSDPRINTVTDENGMAYLYVNRTGRDSIKIIGPKIENGVDSTYYFYTDPDVVIKSGVNKITDFNSDKIEIWKRWKDEFGRDLQNFMVEYTSTKIRNPPLSDFKQTTFLFPSSQITIFFNRSNRPAAYTDEYIDSMFAHVKREYESIDEPGMVRFKISKTNITGQPGILTTFENTTGNLGNTYVTYGTSNNGYYVLFANIDLTPNMFSIQNGKRVFLHEVTAHSVTGASPFHSTNKADASSLFMDNTGLSKMEKKALAHLYTMGIGKKLLRRH